MDTLRLKAILWLAILLQVACSTAEPTPTTVAAAGTIPIVRPTATNTVTPTIIEPTPTSPLPTVVHSHTPQPSTTITPTLTVTPTPTATQSLQSLFDLHPLPELVWTTGIYTIAFVGEAAHVSWSPTANEFASTNCNGPLGYTTIVKLLKVSALDFSPVDITPDTDTIHGLCSTGYEGLVWTQDGQEIISVNGSHLNLLLYGSLWIMNNQGQNAHLISPEVQNIWIPIPIGWHGSQTLFYSAYTGGGISLDI